MNAFEEAVYEVIYRRQRHNNSCAIKQIERKFKRVIDGYVGLQEKVQSRLSITSERSSMILDPTSRGAAQYDKLDMGSDPNLSRASTRILRSGRRDVF